MKKSKIKPIIYILSFILPALAVTLIFAISKFYPFGDMSVLITDMDQQYVDYFVGFRKILLGEDGLFYTWHGGLGMNYIGIFAYYLSSPFTLLILLFPESMITEAILTVIILKISCTGPAFMALLNRRTNKIAPSYLLFSCAYSLMSFCIVYFFNIMWLDAIILLPIICIGIHRLLDKSRSDLLLITLFILFYSNYYISYMTGICVFMYFIMAAFIERKPGDKKSAVRVTAKFFASVCIAAGLAAFLILPAYKALSSCYINMTTFSFTGAISANPLDLIEKSLPGVYDSVTTYGLPNIYCGILAISTLPLFFLNKEITKKHKVFAASVLFLFIISFISYDVSIMWHVFRAPAWFNARHSFTYCFFVILFSFITLSKPKGLTKKHLCIGSGLSLLCVAAAFFIGDWTNGASALVSLGMIVLIYAILFAYVNNRFDKNTPYSFKSSQGRLKTVSVTVLLACFLAEAVFSGCAAIKGLDEELWLCERSSYTDFIKDTKPAVEAAKQYEKQNGNSDFYRMENADMRWSNDNLSLSYNGLAHYSSVSNQHTFRTLNNLGLLCVTNNRYMRYYGTTDILDSVLGIKYVLSRDNEPYNYPKIAQAGDYGIYKNPKALSIAFEASKDILNYNSIQDNPFTAQNSLISALTGENTDCFTLIDDIDITYNDVLIKRPVEGEVYIKKDGPSPYTVYEFEAPKNGQVFLWTFSSIAENCSIYINGKRLGNSRDDFLKGSINLGTYSAGDKITVKVLLDCCGDAYTWKTYAAVMDQQVVDSALAKLSEGNLTDISLSDNGTVLKGKSVMKQDGVLFTTIPYDEGWTLYVDGKEHSYTTMGDKAFIVTELKKGSHNIEFKFVSAGVKPGLIISIISLIIAVMYLIWEAKGKKWQKQ